MALSLVVRLRAKPGAEDRLAALLGDLARASLEEPGCQAFVAHRSPEDGSAFMLYERWEGEAAMESHRATDHFTRAIDEFPLLLVGRADEGALGPARLRARGPAARQTPKLSPQEQVLVALGLLDLEPAPQQGRPRSR